MITKEIIKHTGATFTPRGLADFLSEKLVKYGIADNIKVLDPACGDGELLLSIGEKLKLLHKKFILTGYDSNEYYLKQAHERLMEFDYLTVNLVKGNFLKEIQLTKNQIKLDLFSSSSSINSSIDIVIANPPYVRTQILGAEQAQELARKFELKGRVDLYYPFLIAMTESLKEGGILGVITSNRYLFTKSGASIRKYLSENYEIIELIDLGDTKLFEAAVLPAIFIGRKCKPIKPSEAKFTKIYEELNGYQGIVTSAGNVFEILTSDSSGYFQAGAKRYKKTTGKLKYGISSSETWEMLSDNENEWVSKIEAAAKFRLGELFKVRVGIKTTADNIFIGENWERLGLKKPEDELLKDLISHENIEKWGLHKHLNLKVLYPHYSLNGVKKTIDLDAYPRAKEYLFAHEEKLKSRTYLIESGRKWFEIWVAQQPDLWAYPKLVIPDISPSPRFCFDRGGKIVNGNCYWMVATNEIEIEKLLFVQGIANSNLMTKYHDLVFNNRLYSGRRRYFTQYVEKYPLPDFSTDIAKEIISIVRKLNRENDSDVTRDLEKELEIKVAESYGVEPVFTLD